MQMTTRKTVSPPIPMTRRALFRGVARLLVLGAGSLGGSLLFKRGQITAAGETCASDGVCSGCQVYRDCGLPRALARRRALAQAADAGRVDDA